jgi:hypothetical protein
VFYKVVRFDGAAASLPFSGFFYKVVRRSKKIQKEKPMVGTITWETKGKAKERP